MWYNFDVQRFGWLMLPPLLRKKRLGAILSILLLPLVYLMTQFVRLRQESRRRLRGTGQVASLADTLIDAYGLSGGDIYITDLAPDIVFVYFASEAEVNRTLDKPITLQYADEGRIDPDFVVHVPDILQGEEAEIRRIIDYYRPAGRTYTIQFYQYG